MAGQGQPYRIAQPRLFVLPGPLVQQPLTDSARRFFIHRSVVLAWPPIFRSLLLPNVVWQGVSDQPREEVLNDVHIR